MNFNIKEYRKVPDRDVPCWPGGVSVTDLLNKHEILSFIYSSGMCTKQSLVKF